MQEALDIARRNHEKRAEARALVNLGSIRIQTGDAQQGWRDEQDGLAYYQRLGFRTEAALALILLARATRDKGDYAGARRAFEDTLTTMQPAGPSQPLAMAQEGLGSLEEMQDRWPEALRRFDEARRVFEAIGNSSGSAINEANVALMHALLGHKTGTTVSQQAVDANPVSALRIILMQERYGEARAKAEALLRTADASDLEKRRGASLVLGLALARSGAGARGLDACRKSFDLAHASGNPAAEAEARLAASEAALAAGDRAAAAEYAARARVFFESAGKPESLWRADVLLLRSGAADPAVAAEAAAALAELKALWPAEDFRSYLDRPIIRRMRTELLRVSAKGPTIN
jgi:hypothetical protein